MNKLVLPAFVVLLASPVAAQDVRGLEVCTAEKQMDRRTGCLQANVEFLQQALDRHMRDSNARLTSASRDLAAAAAEIAVLKARLAKLERELAQLKAAAAHGKKP